MPQVQGTRPPQAVRSVRNLHDLTPPSDPDMERALLGAMLTRPHVIDDVMPIVTTADFADPLHAGLFETLVAMHASNQRIDTMLVVAELKKRKLWETKTSADGWTADQLAVVLQACPTAANAKHYASTVRACAVRRELLFAGDELVRLCHDDTLTPQQSLNAAEQRVLAIRDSRTAPDAEPKSIAELLQEAVIAIGNRTPDGGALGLKTGFADLDKIARLRESELTILAARPSMGKSALAMNMAMHVSLQEARRVLFVSIEMSALALTERALSGIAEVPHRNMQEGRLNTEQRQQIIAAAAVLAEAPLYIETPHTVHVRDIASSCRRMKRQGGLGLVVIDYLQLIQADSARDSREQQVAKISSQLKQLARELNIPVLCLSQLNRVVETSPDKTPKLSHLRESGAIEQDADVVMFVHRPGYYMSEEERAAEPDKASKGVVTVAKNRNGQTGGVELSFDSEHVRFVNSALPQHLRNFEAKFDEFNRGDDRAVEELEHSLRQGELPLLGEGQYGG